ncbi:MAG: glycosyltransferase [Pseudomonadota bacterium]
MSLGFQLTILAANEFESPARLSYRVRSRFYRAGLPVSIPEPSGLNAAMAATARRVKPDIVWIDKGLYVRRSTLEAIEAYNPSCRIVGFSPDDMAARHNRSHDFDRHLDCYHAFITTKSYNVAELQREGCPRVVFMPNAFDPETHRPMSDGLTDNFRSVVSFIGTYEAERAASVGRLAREGISVRVWGSFWGRWPTPVNGVRIEGRDVIGGDYACAISGSDINLCFLRKINRDLQTTRSVEIPACGGFMLAERTDEHRALFEEGVEAEYFSSDDELVEKCRYYLAHPEERKKIAAAGRARCLDSRYDYGSRLASALKEIGIAVAESPRP